MTADLKSIVDRVNRLMDERDALTADIRDIYAEAKGRGYIPKALRKVVARMRMDPATLAEDDALLETYEAALGRVGKAMRAVREGATLDEAAEKNGVHRATLARARAVAKQGENATVANHGENATHDPTTGEVHEVERAEAGPIAEAATDGQGAATGPLDTDADTLEIPPFLRRVRAA